MGLPCVAGRGDAFSHFPTLVWTGVWAGVLAVGEEGAAIAFHRCSCSFLASILQFFYIFFI